MPRMRFLLVTTQTISPHSRKLPARWLLLTGIHRRCARADYVLKKRGGDGAVREVCDLLISRMEA